MADAQVDYDFDDLALSDDERASLPPTCTFRLGGKVWTVRHKDLVSFDAMFAITHVTEAGIPLAVGPFFDGVLDPAQTNDFRATLARPDVTLLMATEAIKTIASALLGRPTKPSGNSARGRKPTRARSAGGSSSRATRKRASAS